MVRTVRLYGELGRMFGRVHRFDISSPAEAFRALSANFPGFFEYLNSERRFKVVNGDYQLGDAQEVNDPASGTIKIVPVVSGSNAESRVLVGAAIAVAGVLVSPFAPTVGGILVNAGAALALGGVIEMLSPPPKINEPPERPENKPSYLFNGPVNTTAQGHPVPVLYGRMIVGSAVVSAGIDTENIEPKTLSMDLEGLNDGVPNNAPPFYFSRVYLRQRTASVPSPGGGSVTLTFKTYRYFYYE